MNKDKDQLTCHATQPLHSSSTRLLRMRWPLSVINVDNGKMRGLLCPARWLVM